MDIGHNVFLYKMKFTQNQTKKKTGAGQLSRLVLKT